MINFNRYSPHIFSLLFTSSKQRAFLEDIATLLEDGIAIQHAIETLYQLQSPSKTPLTEKILLSLAQGNSFSDGLIGYFPQHIVEIIHAGELSGDLVRALRTSATIIEHKSDVVSSLLNALTYPITVLCLALVVLVFVNREVFSDFQSLLPLTMWPERAQLLVSMAVSIQFLWPFMVLFIIGASILTYYGLKNLHGSVREWLDNLPVIKLYRSFVAARFLEVLGLLLSNGVVLKRSLEVLQEQATPYFSSHLDSMMLRIASGHEKVGEVLDTGLIEEQAIVRIRLLSNSETLPHAMVRIGQQVARKSQQQLVYIGRVSGALLLFVSAIIAAALILSLYQVGSLLGKV